MLSPMARTLVIAAASTLLFATMAQAGGNPQRTRSADASRSLVRTAKDRQPRARRPTSVAEANAERAARQVKAKCERRELDCSRDKELKAAEGEG